jgi:two-component system phosphate regulon sensor histidine kinase PhoR
MPWNALAIVSLCLALSGWFFLVWHRRRTLAEVIRALDALDHRRPIRPIHAPVGGLTGQLARTVNDVAPRLLNELQTLESERQQLDAVLGGMTEGVIAVDLRRRLVFANNAAARLFNLPPDSVGRMMAQLIRCPGIQQAVDATLGPLKSFRGEIHVDCPISWPTGSGHCLEVHGTALPGAPPAGAVLVFHDVTELRRLERMRQDFVANASHELKTPLAAIKAYTETLIDWAMHDPQVNLRFLKQIDEQANRLHLLVQDMLALARLESGAEVATPPEPLPVAHALERFTEAHRDRAEAKHLSYEFHLDPDTHHVEILADEEALQQILDNLIDNAIKYTPPGGRVRVSTRFEHDLLRIDVADTGIGIPRQDLARVFERFFRVDRARSRELGGTGLGLSIVKHQVNALGGQIQVESRVGRGTTFTVLLPITTPLLDQVPAHASTPSRA